MIIISKKTNLVGCKLSDDELNLLTTLVMQSGLSNQSEYIRQKILKEEPKFPGQALVDRLIELEKKIEIYHREIMKKEYVIQKIVAACLLEMVKKESANYKDIVSKFVMEIENEADSLFSSKEG